MAVRVRGGRGRQGVRRRHQLAPRAGVRSRCVLTRSRWAHAKGKVGRPGVRIAAGRQDAIQQTFKYTDKGGDLKCWGVDGDSSSDVMWVWRRLYLLR